MGSSAFIAMNKYTTHHMLAMANIPVPKAVLLHNTDLEREPLENTIANLRFPLVIKPVDRSLKKGVLCNINTMKDLRFFLKKYCSLYQSMVIEECHERLQSYRVLVFNRQVIGVVLCHPAKVLGDGKHTVKELIELANIRLQELGVNEDYIPVKGETIVLYYSSSHTRGGTYESLGTTICKENRQLMTKIASTLNLGLVEIDVACTDITIPISQSQGVILDVNHRPSMLIYERPIIGKPRPVTKKIMLSCIYRHPFAYLYSLYSKKLTRFHKRAVVISIVSAAIYWFI